MSTTTVLSAQLSSVHALFAAQNACSVDAVMALISDDPAFRLIIRPGSIAGGFPEEGFPKDTVRSTLEGLFAGMKTMGFGEPEEVTQVPNKVVVWIKTNGEKRDGSLFTNEYMFTIYFKPDDTKFIKVVEFCDSLYVATAAKAHNEDA